MQQELLFCLQAHAAAKRTQRLAVVAFKDSQAAEEELVRNGPELDEGRPDELKSTVAQKRADLVIYQQQVPQ
jgi:hypothetical protein